MHLVDWLCGLTGKISSDRRSLKAKKRTPRTSSPVQIESLETRIVLTASGTFDASNNVTVTGDNDPNILLEADGLGYLTLNGVQITDGINPILVKDVATLTVNGDGGVENITLDVPEFEIATEITINGGDGADTIQVNTLSLPQATAFTIDGGNDSDVLNFTGTVSVAGTSATLAATAESINVGGDVDTSGNQTYTGAVTVTGGDRTFISADGKVEFDGTVDGGGFNLTVDADIDINDEVSNVANLSITKSADLGASVNTTGNQTYTGTVTISATSVDLVSTATAIPPVPGDITFETTVDGLTDGANSLTINTPGSVNLLGVLGTTPLGTITIDVGAASKIDINGGTVTTAGDQAYNGDVTLSANTTLTSGGKVTFSGKVDSDGVPVDGYSLEVKAVGLTTFGKAVGSDKVLSSLTTDASAGDTNINGGSVKTSGTQTYGDNVVLGAATTLTTTPTGKINNKGTIAGGGFNLTIDGAADVDGAISGVNKFEVSLTTDLGADVTTTADQIYTGAVTGSGGNRILTSTAGTINFGTTVAGGTNDLKLDGIADINGAITGVGKFEVTKAADLGADVSTTADQIYTGAVTISGGNRILTSTSGTVNFGTTVAGGTNNLKLDAIADINGPITGVGKFEVTKASDLGADVTTNEDQIYTGAVTISGGNRILTSTTGTVNFGTTVDGGTNNLKLDAIADINGSITGVGKFEVTKTSDLGADVTTTADQIYTGAVTISGGNRILTSTASTINFVTTVAGGTNNLKLDAIADINGAITGVANFEVTKAADLGGDVTTTGTQKYDAAVIVSDTIPESLAARKLSGHDFTFVGSVNSDSVDTPRSLSLAADATTGVIKFQADVGATAPLGTLSTDSTKRFPALQVTSGKELTFESTDGTAATVRLAGSLGIDATSIDVIGISNDVVGVSTKPQIRRVRTAANIEADVVQNVVEITASGVTENVVTLSNLDIMDDAATFVTGGSPANPGKGNGVVITSTSAAVNGPLTGGTQLTQITLTKLNIFNNPDNGVYLNNAKDVTIGSGVDPDASLRNDIHNNGHTVPGANGFPDTLIGSGVAIAENDNSINNRIQLNSIHNNTKLGIDLDDDGRTSNEKDSDPTDADDGANKLQNTPEILYAFKYFDPVNDVYSLQLLLHVPSPTDNGAKAYIIDVYSADGAFQEGETYIAPLSGSTDSYSDKDNHAVIFEIRIDATLFGTLQQGTSVFVATATDPDGNTSEFSLPVALNLTPDVIIKQVAATDTPIEPNPGIVETLASNADRLIVLNSQDDKTTRRVVAVSPVDTKTTLAVVDTQPTNPTTRYDHSGGLYQVTDTAGSVDGLAPAAAGYAAKAISDNGNNQISEAKTDLNVAGQAEFGAGTLTQLGAYMVRSDNADPLDSWNDTNTANATTIGSPDLAFFSYGAANSDNSQSLGTRQTGYAPNGSPILGTNVTVFTGMEGGTIYNHLGKIYLRVEDGALILPWEDNVKSVTDQIRVKPDGTRDSTDNGRWNVNGTDGLDHLAFGDYNDAVFALVNTALQPLNARTNLTVSFADFKMLNSNLPPTQGSASVDAPAPAANSVDTAPETTDSNSGGDSTSDVIPVIVTSGTNSNGSSITNINGVGGSTNTTGSTDTGDDAAESGKKTKQPKVKAPKVKHEKEHPVKVRTPKQHKGK